MERNANYTLVGFVSLLIFLAAVVFVIWLGRFQFNRDFDLYDIVFAGPVRGLTEGGEVHFNGIKVGEVTKIGLDPRNPTQVVARARVTSDVPIRTDSFATLEPQGITGVNYVQITPGTTRNRLLKEVTPDGQVPILRSQPSALSDLLEGGGTVLARAVEALDRVNKVLSDRNIATLSATLGDVNVLTAEAREQRQIFADARAAIQSFDKAAADISAATRSARELVDGDGKRALDDVGKAADEIKAAAADARSMINSLKGPTTDFAVNGLPQLQSAIIGLQSATESLERLANEIENSPRALITKEPAREIEVQP